MKFDEWFLSIKIKKWGVGSKMPLNFMDGLLNQYLELFKWQKQNAWFMIKCFGIDTSNNIIQ